MALLPAPFDKRPGVAFLIKKKNDLPGEIFCSCRLSQKGACDHMHELKKVFMGLKKKLNKKPLDYRFRSGIWYQVASVLMDGNSVPLKTIRLNKVTRKTGDMILITDAGNKELLRYFSQNNDTARFI